MASSDQQDTSRRGTPPLVFDEVRWVVQIRQSLEEDAPRDDDDDTGIPVSVFNVPKPLLVLKPEAYTPQFIALGPYHHWRPELYEMDRYKLAAARRAQKRLRGGGGVRLDALVDQFKRVERKVRAHYHRYLDFSGETLAWMMLVDGAFLLEFLQVYAVAATANDSDVATAGDGKALRRVSSRMQHLVDFAGRKSAHNLILRDMVMLENQVPLFLLRRILEPQCASPAEAAELLPRMVTGLMKELCPFKTLDKFPAIDVGKNAHLLEVLYYLLVPRPADDGVAAAAEADAVRGIRREDGYDIEEQQPVDGGVGGGDDEEQKPAAGCEYVKQLLLTVSSMASGLKSGRLRYVTRPLAFAVKAPWKMLTVVPGFSAMKQPVEAFFMSGDDGSTTRGHDANGGAAGYLARPPLGPLGVRAGQRRRQVPPDLRRPVHHRVRRQDGDVPPARGDPGLQHGGGAPEPGRVRGVGGVGPAGAGAVHGADERRHRHRRRRGAAAAARGGAEPDEERRRGGQAVERDDAVGAAHQGGVRGQGHRGGEPLLQLAVAGEDEAVHAQVRVQLVEAAHLPRRHRDAAAHHAAGLLLRLHLLAMVRHGDGPDGGLITDDILVPFLIWLRDMTWVGLAWLEMVQHTVHGK